MDRLCAVITSVNQPAHIRQSSRRLHILSVTHAHSRTDMWFGAHGHNYINVVSQTIQTQLTHEQLQNLIYSSYTQISGRESSAAPPLPLSVRAELPARGNEDLVSG